jgi:hypothetical protein
MADEDLRTAIHALETGLRKEFGDLALKVERTRGTTEILKSRFDSEVGHLRREVGEALDKLDRNVELASRVGTAEVLIGTAQKKIDDAVHKLDDSDMSKRLIVMETKNGERERADGKRDKITIGVIAAVVVLAAKQLWATLFGSHG